MSLSGVQVHLVESLDDALAFKRWLGERHENNTIAVDTETTGLDPREPGAGIRLIQFGDTMTGWAVPWEDWRGLAMETLTQWDGLWALWNFAFEQKWLSVHAPNGYRLPRDRCVDGMIAAHIINPLGPGGLKQNAAKFVDRRAVAGQNALNTGMADNGWTWKTVPINYQPYWAYASLDAVLTTRLWGHFKPQVGPGGPYAQVFDLEMAVRFIVSRMEEHGAQVDVEYARQQLQRLDHEAGAVEAWAKAAFGINIASNDQLGRKLIDLGGVLLDKTATGKDKVDKYTLQVLKDPENGYPAAVQTLAEQALRARQARKFASTYFKNLVEKSYGGLVHADVRTLGARTGRMCIPDSHQLVTPSGPMSVDQVKIGDWTIDHEGRWTQVLEMHRYRQQPTTIWKHAYVELECTDEHRWVTTSERGAQRIEPLGARSRQYVHLAPDTTKFDFSLTEFDAVSDDEKFAALVGLLVTDGRCTDDGGGAGLRAMVYQTEKKFYKQIRNIIPSEAVMYDRITAAGDLHHEIRIKTRWLRPRLAEAGIDVPSGSSLRQSNDLIPWLMRQTDRAVAQFLRAVWLADGRTTHPRNPVMSCTVSENLRTAVRLAAYRLGYSTSVSLQAPGEWGTQDRITIGFKSSTWITRKMERTPSTSDVWCVTTESGTFTAWSPSYGPYLTGNSVSNPPLQQIPKSSSLVRNAFVPSEGNVLVTADYSQIEMRLVAEASGDPGLIEAFRTADSTGGDFFVEMGKQIYADPRFHKSDKRRGLIKNTMYGKAYGAGPAKMAESAGVPVSRMQAVVETIEERFPGLTAFMKQVESDGWDRQRDEGQGYVVTPLGRRLPADENRLYALTNYYVQSWAADVLKEALVRLDASGYDSFMVLPVHDEIVIDIPAEYAEQALHDVPILMQELDHAIPLTADAEGPLDRWGRKYE